MNLPVHQIFAHPTIGELAEIVSADPDFGAGSAGESELDELSDDELDQLLRAALASATAAARCPASQVPDPAARKPPAVGADDARSGQG